MQGHVKKKTYDPQKFYVVNHESGTIYNDIASFDQANTADILKSFNSYGKDDATIVLRGRDGLILKSKGDD